MGTNAEKKHHIEPADRPGYIVALNSAVITPAEPIVTPRSNDVMPNANMINNVMEYTIHVMYASCVFSHDQTR
jgi:hypothetical protein